MSYSQHHPFWAKSHGNTAKSSWIRHHDSRTAACAAKLCWPKTKSCYLLNQFSLLSISSSPTSLSSLSASPPPLLLLRFVGPHHSLLAFLVGKPSFCSSDNTFSVVLLSVHNLTGFALKLLDKLIQPGLCPAMKIDVAVLQFLLQKTNIRSHDRIKRQRQAVCLKLLWSKDRGMTRPPFLAGCLSWRNINSRALPIK